MEINTRSARDPLLDMCIKITGLEEHEITFTSRAHFNEWAMEYIGSLSKADSGIDCAKDALAAIFGRPAGGMWNHDEDRALADIWQGGKAMHEIREVAPRYAQFRRMRRGKKEHPIPRHTLLTLLQNWPAEIAKLQEWEEEKKPKPKPASGNNNKYEQWQDEMMEKLNRANK